MARQKKDKAEGAAHKGRLPVGEARLRIAGGDERGRKPIQVRAEILRHWHAPTSDFAWRGLAAMPDDPTPDSNDDHPGTGWREADLKRAIDVAEKAGLQSYRVEIATDGTISIAVGNRAQGTENRPTKA